MYKKLMLSARVVVVVYCWNAARTQKEPFDDGRCSFAIQINRSRCGSRVRGRDIIYISWLQSSISRALCTTKRKSCLQRWMWFRKAHTLPICDANPMCAGSSWGLRARCNKSVHPQPASWPCMQILGKSGPREPIEWRRMRLILNLH